MARKVKCKITGEEGTTDTFVKIGKAYYKSQEIYDARERQKNARREVIETISVDFLGYDSDRQFSTFLAKKIKDFESYGFDVVKETVRQHHDSIEWAMNNKNFTTEQRAISYIMAVINNHINDVYKQMKKEEKEQEKATKKDVVMDDTVLEDIQDNSKKQKGIKKWLEEDEWN